MAIRNGSARLLKMGNFNKRHPELEEGEWFRFNCRNNKRRYVIFVLRKKYPDFEWRLGETAYDDSGRVVKYHRPIFKKKKVQVA